MYKNQQQKEQRKLLITHCIEDPSGGAETIRKYAKRLKNSRNTIQVVEVLSDLLSLSKETIFKDYMDCKDTEKHSE